MRIRCCAAGCGGFGHESVCVRVCFCVRVRALACVILGSGSRLKEGAGGEDGEEQSSEEVQRRAGEG